jgi:citrate lyase subunit beta / citryl-CoA lyase
MEHNTPVRPRRSMLIVPAGRQRPVDKSFETETDIVMLDLDDGVVFTDEHKREARERVVRSLQSRTTDKEVVIRTNALDTPWWEADLRAVAPLGVAAVVPAKVESAADVAAIDRVLLEDCPANSVRIWPMVESVGAVMRAQEIATASVRVEALCFGVGDFTVSAHAEFHDSIEHLTYPLGQVLCTARMHGLTAIAPAVVFSDVDRLDLLEAQALFLRKLGYDGAMVVTPRHLETVNGVFTPAPDEVEWALKLERAIEDAHREGQSAVVVDGKLVEIVNHKLAQHKLALARALDLVPAEAPAVTASGVLARDGA